jgi:flagellar motor switch protein FliM
MSDASHRPRMRAIEKMVRERAAADHERYPLLDPVFENLALGMWSAVRPILGEGAEVAWEAAAASSFADYCEAAGPGSVFGAFRLTEWDGQGLIAMGASLVDAAVEALLGGGQVVGQASGGAREPTMLDQALAGRFMRLAVDELARAFVRTEQGLGPLTAKLLKVESNPRLLTVARRDEMMIKASFQVTLGPGERGGPFDLLLPHATLEPARRRLLNAAPRGRRRVDEPTSSPLLAVLPETPVTLHAIVDRLTLTLAEIAQWQAGTLLPLGVDAERPTVVYAERKESPGLGRRMFVGRLGASQGRKAVRILEVIPDPAQTSVKEAQR